MLSLSWGGNLEVCAQVWLTVADVKQVVGRWVNLQEKKIKTVLFIANTEHGWHKRKLSDHMMLHLPRCLQVAAGSLQEVEAVFSLSSAVKARLQQVFFYC